MPLFVLQNPVARFDQSAESDSASMTPIVFPETTIGTTVSDFTSEKQRL
jgi:hypothetical protein